MNSITSFFVPFLLLTASLPALADPGVLGIHPDLQVGPPAYGSETLSLMREKIYEISTEEALVPAEMAFPDYRYAYQALQDSVVSALENYFTTLETINQELKVYYSQLYALAQQAETDTTGVFAIALKKQFRQDTPAVQASIQEKYVAALRRLYTLGDAAVIPMKRKGRLDQLHELHTNPILPGDSLLGICQTTVCTLTLA